MSTATSVQIDMVRLAALLGRLDAGHAGNCTVEGCVHDHGDGGAQTAREVAAIAA